jgi:hypothetical protein
VDEKPRGRHETIWIMPEMEKPVDAVKPDFLEETVTTSEVVDERTQTRILSIPRGVVAARRPALPFNMPATPAPPFSASATQVGLGPSPIPRVPKSPLPPAPRGLADASSAAPAAPTFGPPPLTPAPNVEPLSAFAWPGAPPSVKLPTLPAPNLPPPSLPMVPQAPGSASRLGVLAASNAAAGGVMAQPEPRPDDKVVAAGALPTAEQQEIIDLLAFDPKSLARLRTSPVYRPILDHLASEPPDPDIDDPALDVQPAESEARRSIFEILAHGEALSIEALRAAVQRAVRPDGRFVAPLVLVAGDILFPPDEIAALRVTVATVSPFAPGDERVKQALDLGRELLKEAPPPEPRSASKPPDSSTSAAFAASLAARIIDAYAAGKRVVPPAYVDAQIDRALLEQRSHQRRSVLGGARLRGLLKLASVGAGRKAGGGASPEPSAIPVYLPEDLGQMLPMRRHFKVRLLAEAHFSVDEAEEHPIALLVKAIAKIEAFPTRW